MGAVRLWAAVAALVLLGASCGGEAVARKQSDEEWQLLRDEQVGLSVRYPPGWYATNGALTEVVSPPHRLLVTSFRFDQADTETDCSPITLLKSLPPHAAFIILFEYTVGPIEGSPWVKDVQSRPSHFVLDDKDFANYECFGPSYKIQFVEQGRVFQSHVSFGKETTIETRALALDVLDSLAVAPGR